MSDAAAQPAPKPAPTIEDRVRQYVMLRDKIKEMDDAHKASMKPYRETLEKLNSVLLQQLITIGGDSMKTASGTVYRTQRSTASLEDPAAFMQFVTDKGLFELLDRKANVTAVQDFANENGVLPPGVKITTTTDVGVRRPTK